MLKVLQKTLCLSPALFCLTICSGAFAQERSTALQSVPQQTGTLSENSAENTLETDSFADQITSVSQLSDVKPTDWAFQALQSLVERYGCIVGYPDRTYRGNRALSRYEFAAGLNACMDRINELIAAGTADLVRKEDLDALRKMQEQFAAELAVMRGRVDAVEVRTATLEKQQFSTTTKLNGEVVMAVAGVAAGNTVNGNQVQKNTVVGDRVRLNFDTSFNGKDLLRTRIQASNLDPFSQTATFTPEGDLRFAAGNDNNRASIDALLYQFTIGEKTTVVIEANAGAIDDFTNTVNPYFDGDGTFGALGHFGTRNPIYYLLDGTGVGVRHEFSKQLELSAGYLATDANNPNSGNGLFNGAYGAIAQLTFTPSDKLAFALTYIHSYKTDYSTNGSAGSNHANLLNLGQPFVSNAYGAEASYQLSPHVVINGYVGYNNASVLEGTKGNANIWDWMVGLAFPDFLQKGSVAGILVGVEPKVTSASSNLNLLEDNATSFHVEGFYQYQITDHIAITPGIIWLTNPDQNSGNSDVVIGTIRTTFTF